MLNVVLKVPYEGNLYSTTPTDLWLISSSRSFMPKYPAIPQRIKVSAGLYAATEEKFPISTFFLIFSTFFSRDNIAEGGVPCRSKPIAWYSPAAYTPDVVLEVELPGGIYPSVVVKAVPNGTG